MPHSRYNEDVPSGFYRSTDNIRHFKIRICIKKVASACLQLNSGDTLPTSQHEMQLLSNQNKHATTECVFRWQEKVSKEEDKEISASTLQITKSSNSDLEKSNNKIQLYTLVDCEIKSAKLKSNEQNISLSKDRTRCKGNALFHSHTNKTYQKLFILNEKDVIQNSSKESRCDFPCEMMAVMAILDLDDGSGNQEGVELCLIKRYPCGILVISPDFNTSPYYVYSGPSESFEFVLQNASKNISKLDSIKEEKFLKQISLSNEEILLDLVGEQFNMPPPDSIILYLHGEIISGSNFDAKYIFVQYRLQPSGGISSDCSDSLSGATQTSKVIKKNAVQIAGFGHIFNHEIPIDSHQLKEFLPKLKLIVEVTSVDYWGIFRNEGYGFCDITISPGTQNHDIATWKLLPPTIYDKLQNFFLGGTPCLNNSSYVTVPEDLQSSCLGKCAKTETSGSVAVKVNIVIHYGSESSSNNFVHKQQVASDD